MKVTAVRYLTFVGLLSLLIGGGLYLAAPRRDVPKGDERTAAATAPVNTAEEVSIPEKPSGANPPVSPPEAVKRPNVFGLSGPVQLDDVPAGRFRNELSRLNEPARRQALEKLGRLRVPLNDVASLSVDRDGQLFYQCSPPQLPPVPAQTSSAWLEAQLGSPAGVPEVFVAAASVAITSPPVRHSRPGASKTIYLDFNGLTISGTAWNNERGTVGDADYRPAVASYVAKPFDTDGDASTFSDGEQTVIVQIWERVAEDFRPFDVDVTTEEPASFTSNTGRILITTNVDENGVNMPSSTAAGVAYIDVFGNFRYASYYSPALVYFNQLSKYGPYIAEAASHEIGHNLSLSHDGTATGDEYYDGHGTGENSWGAIMGAGYNRNVTQWSKGDYYNANNTQDDLALIAGHLSYMPADGTDSNATANPLAVSGLTVSGSGIIAQTGEADRFSFASGAGAISFNVLPTRSATLPYGANLDVALELYDSSGTLVASSNVDGVTTAALNTTVAGGTYYLRVLGAGSGTPLNNPPSGYTSYASVGQYTISGTVVSTAPVAPSITSQPTNQTVYAGQTAQFTVAASGYPAPSFQWQRLPAGSGTWIDLANGGSYSGVTTVTLSVAGSTTAMNGDQFRCVATSGAQPAATSAGATITVNASAGPSFTLQPLSQTITAGLSVTFTAAASGAPTPTYQWKKDGVNINGATSSSYTIANVGASQAGNYTVVATNLVSSATSNIAVLTVQSLPAFTTQPVSQTVTVGNSVTFTSVASGMPAPTYQWKKNGVAISGATGSSYSIATVAITDSGNYTVVATNVAGPTTSNTAVLTVQSVPLFTTQPVSQTVTKGNPATFTAAAIGLPIPTYQWRKDGVNISGATSGTYTIANTAASDAGNYTMVATNSAGAVTSSVASLTIQYAPVFTTTPGSQTVFATQSVSFSATASGVPLPTFQWQKDGVNISGAISNSYTIASAVVADSGNYTMVATNALGSVTCSPAALTVNPSSIPAFVTQPSDQSVLVGRPVTFTALANGIPAVTYRWQKNGVNIAGATNNSYTIATAALIDTGNYSVVATNAVGATSSNWIILTVYAADSGVYTFTTLAGHASIGSVDGTGSAAQFNMPSGVAVDAGGNVYVADSGNATIRKITPLGAVSTFAGTANNFGSVDGTGGSARFVNPFGVAADAAGNIYVADNGDHTIRKITPSGVVGTLAGFAGTAGSTNGTGTAAQFNQPCGVAVDSLGNVYVADAGNHTIRKITPVGVVTTFAGTAGVAGSVDGTGSAAQFNAPRGVAVDAAGNIYIADSGNYAIRKITPVGVVTTYAGSAGVAGSVDGASDVAQFNFPLAVTADALGNIYVADGGANTLRQITPAGVVTTLAGYAYYRGSSDGTGSTALFQYPAGVAADSAGNVYVADYYNHTVRKVTPAGVVTTWAGDAGYGSADGPGNIAKFAYSNGVAVDGSGNAYVADTANNTIRMIVPGGAVTTVAGMAGVTGLNDGTSSAASFTFPNGLTVDGAGNIYVADTYGQTIRKIDSLGVVTTLAGGYFSQSGSTDGVGRAAQFNAPTGVATDRSGNIYVADAGNHTIRKITPTGLVTTLAGLAGSSGSANGLGNIVRFNYPTGVAVDGAGNVYVADSQNVVIRKITPRGDVTTLAGSVGFAGLTDGTGNAAQFWEPKGVAVDGAGNVYVADGIAIRKITPIGVVTTLAGTTASAGSTDGLGNAVRFRQAYGVAVDSAGNVYVADSGNNTIRWGAMALPVRTSAGTASGTLGQSFTHTVIFSGTLSPYSASGLPAGLNFDTVTGVISGTPTVTGTFPVTLGAINGAGATTAALTLTIVSGVATPATVPHSDFNQDSRSDILWTNTVTGDRAIWFMNGTAIGTNAFAGTVPVAWTVSGTGDFDGDGKADIFWTNKATGDRAMWLMNGSAISSGAYLGVIPVEWVVSGTGDFNGDGKADVLWTNSVTGDRAVWLMNGGVLSAGASLGVVPVAWVVSGTGDFNGDGKADILLSNTVTGDRVMWFMNGTAIGTNAFAGTVPVAWIVSGVGDFDGDGKADIFWTNTQTGDRAAWLMNGNTNSAGGYLGAIPVAWVISATGDYNGDGKADILWSNTVTGERSMWLMNGLTAAGGASLGLVPVAWVPAN